MSKFNVGDKVRIKDYMDPNGAMCGMMLEQFGGKVCTISKADTETGSDGTPVDVYEIAEDYSTPKLKFRFLNEDIECLVLRACQKTPAKLCETVFDITAVAVDMIHAGTIEVEDSRELFQTIYKLASRFEDTDYDAEEYMDAVGAYARKWLTLEYGDFSNMHGRIWWDIEEQKFVGEAQLYDEYLVNRHDDMTFEEYIRGCRTEENGTLELVREGLAC